MARRALAAAALLAVAAGVALAAYTAAGFRPAPPHPPRLAWFCRIRVSPAVPSGPACVRYPAAYRPPWPYLGQDGREHYPSPAPGGSPRG